LRRLHFVAETIFRLSVRRNPALKPGTPMPSALFGGSRASGAFVKEFRSMENEREETRDQNEGSGQQRPLGQQNDNSQQFGQQESGQQQGQRPLGEQGDFGTQEPGLNDQQSGQTGGQSSTGQASDDQGETSTLTDSSQSEPGSSQQTGQSDGGFVGSQGQESGEYLQQGGNPESGFAEQGRGSPNQSGDIEREDERSENRDSDIEGSSGGNI
jgi:hypothetical protein